MEPNIEALNLMERIGGGFASPLATAWKKADLDNQRRLMSVFKDLHDTYVGYLKLVKED